MQRERERDHGPCAHRARRTAGDTRAVAAPALNERESGSRLAPARAAPPPRGLDPLPVKVEGGKLWVKYQYYRQLVPTREVIG